MENNKRVVFEVVKLNSEVKQKLDDLEFNGYLKRVLITKDGKLDLRTLKNK